MLFFRDRQVYENLKCKPHAPIVGVAGTDRIIGFYPPCGVLPCQNFSRYCGPFSYISEKTEDVYYIFRAFYCKYFCYLHTISSHNQSIISLCKLFEDLLQMYEPEVCFHLNSLGISPLKTAFQWIFYAFVGFLEIDQVTKTFFLMYFFYKCICCLIEFWALRVWRSCQLWLQLFLCLGLT